MQVSASPGRASDPAGPARRRPWGLEIAYAEQAGVRWFILSAQQGLVSPDEVLEPYELRLSKTAREYRREWGQRVVNQLGDTMLGTVTASELRLSVGDTGFEPVRPRPGDTGSDLRCKPLTCAFEEQ